MPRSVLQRKATAALPPVRLQMILEPNPKWELLRCAPPRTPNQYISRLGALSELVC